MKIDQVEVTSTAPAERVFAILTDWPRHREWMPFTRAEGGHELGATLRGWTGVGRFSILDTMVITEWTPGRRVETRHTGRLVKGDGWFETIPLPSGGTRIVWAERLDPPLPRPLWNLAAPLFHSFMRLGLRRLAKLAEA